MLDLIKCSERTLSPVEATKPTQIYGKVEFDDLTSVVKKKKKKTRFVILTVHMLIFCS